MQDKNTQSESFLGDVEMIAHRKGVTIQEACSFIGISRSTYYKVKAGMMAPTKKTLLKVDDARNEMDKKPQQIEEMESYLDSLPNDELARLIPNYQKEQHLLREIGKLSGFLCNRDMLDGITKTARKMLDAYFEEHANENFKTLKDAMENLLQRTSNKDMVATCVRVLDEIRSPDPSVDRLLSRMWLGMKLPPRN